MKNNFLHILLVLLLSTASCRAIQPTVDAAASATNTPKDSSKMVEWKLISMSTQIEADKLSIDPYSSIYISDLSGNIRRYDSTGKWQLTYSPVRKGQLTLLESWRYVNTFAFYRNFQSYLILDRFLNSSSDLEINNERIGYARLATFSLDNNTWIVDETDFSLVKYNTTFNSVELKTNLDLLLDPELYELTFMREYQNQVFLCDKNSGIIIFDNLGNYKNKISAKNVEFISFVEDNLVYVEEGELVLRNIYKGTEKRVGLPAGAKPTYVVMSPTRVFLLSPSQLSIYQSPF